MTTRSSSKKTLQSIHVRNLLWDAFTKHSEKMDCSVDYLINEAMRIYAEQHEFIDAAAGEAARRDSTAERSGRLPLPGQTGASQLSQAMTPPPAPPTAVSPSSVGAPVAPPPVRGSVSQQLPRPGQTGSTAPVRPVQAPRKPAPARPRPTLTLIFRGRKFPVVKDQFIIGRGSKSSDLTIKDGNISRKHAAVIYHNGAFYIKDLGSTNGIEYNGRPVDSKRIDEGDVFSVCGYDFHFTYTV